MPNQSPYSGLDIAETPTLFLKFPGSEASIEEQAMRSGDIMGEFGGGPSTALRT